MPKPMGGRRGGQGQPKTQDEFQERVIQIKRVSKKTSGGSTMSFAALVVVGDKKGRVGTGYGKGRDVSSGIAKAVASARRQLVTVNMAGSTIPHEVATDYSSASILMKPAPKGAGIIAGGAVRIVLDLAGIKDVSAKMLGSNNKIANIRCALKALEMLKKVEKAEVKAGKEENESK